MTMETLELLPTEIIDLHSRTAPADVVAMARDMGIEVIYRPMGELSGSIKRIRPARYLISVNNRHSHRRQRFTLAHEIAHYVLHRSIMGDGIVDDELYRSAAGGEIEREADRYATSILMPAPLVRQIYREGTKSKTGLADRFDVSDRMAEIRMRELHLG